MLHISMQIFPFNMHAVHIVQWISVLQCKMNQKPHGENVLAKSVDSQSDILKFLGAVITELYSLYHHDLTVCV